MRKLELSRGTKDTEDPEEAFYILVPSLISWSKEYNVFFPVSRNVCSLIETFVYQSFYKVLFGGHPLSTYAKYVRVHIRELEMLDFWNILYTYLLDRPLNQYPYFLNIRKVRKFFISKHEVF